MALPPQNRVKKEISFSGMAEISFVGSSLSSRVWTKWHCYSDWGCSGDFEVSCRCQFNFHFNFHEYS
uniref:HDC07885 n=1 Tax=Drosophila melanogaster TaxID=7227 RepID=Q6ILZ9_DROME|nr:TPA_inf: HDC07885 [Drosophila melanogaster]